VEARFQDESALNTYRTGYQGYVGERVEYAGIGNTGLDFPRFPYMDLGGDSPSSTGFYGRFALGNLSDPDKKPMKLHTLVRFDRALAEERSFQGGRERIFLYKRVSERIRGRYFMLPNTDLPDIPVV
jgi:hypothetical protein